MAKKIRDIEEEESVPVLVYLKVIFLVLIIVLGMIFLSRATRQNIKEKSTSRSLSPFSKDRVATLSASLNRDKIMENVGNEIQSNALYKKTVVAIEEKRNDVMGVATVSARGAAETAKKTLTALVYQHVLRPFMEQFIEKLPESEKTKLIEDVKK